MSGWALTKRGGKTVDVHTAAVIDAAERKLGYPLTIVQGSPNRGVGASAGTHDRQGVIDLAPFDAERKVRVFRELGCAAWFRPAIRGLWGPHIHVVVIGHKDLAPAAARQVDAYLAGRDGLASNGPDTGPRDFVQRRFAWPPTPTRVQRAAALMEQAAVLLWHAQRDGKRRDVLAARLLLRQARKRMPKR